MNPNIEKNFSYHPPTVTNGEAHARIRAAARDLAQLIDDLVPSNAGREKAIAQTHVESAMMFACAGVVRHATSVEGVNDGDVRVYPPNNPTQS